MIEFLSFIWTHLDWFAMAALLVGYFRMSTFKIDGWVWTCTGSILLVIFGTVVVPSAMGVAVGNLAFVGVTISGYFKWRKSSKTE